MPATVKISRETVQHPEGSLRCMDLRLRAFGGELHRHGHVELTWIERGQGLRWVGDTVEPFVDGDLVLVAGETAHLWASRGTPPEGDCAATVLQLRPDWPLRTGLPELAGLSALWPPAGGGWVVEGPTRAAVQAEMARLRGASPAQRIARVVDVLALLQAGGSDLRALSGRAPAADPVPGRRRIDRVLSWIEAHLSEDLRVDDAAAIAHVSAAAFARFFRREVGRSFTAYINDARCSWAALRLMQSREPIAQIAQGCGFPTLSNFGEQFRRRYGVAPRDFRAGQRLSQSRAGSAAP